MNITASSLSSDMVHVWVASLAGDAALAHDMAQLLSDDETHRAERLYNRQDRVRFMIRRGVTRILLGQYLGVAPPQVRFEYTRFGKPRVAAGLVPGGLEFNLAHSRDIALYAFTRGRAVGVDVERVRPLPDMQHVARSFFSARENEALLALPEEAQLTAFYQCWTHKEAYLKATGKGLASDLTRFDVSLAPGVPPRLLNVEGDAAEAGRWSLHTLSPAAGYVAALAVEGHGWRLIQRRWHEDRPA